MPRQDHREDDIFFPFAGREGVWARELPNIYEGKLTRLVKKRAGEEDWAA